MTSKEPQWWFRARGTLPTQDYSWTDLQGRRSPDAGTLAKPAENLSMPGVLTIAFGNWGDQRDNVLSVYIDGITSDAWPLDAVGRPIELTVLGIADSIDTQQQLMTALSTLATIPARDRIGTLLSFGASSDLGWTIHAKGWSQLLSEPELGRGLAKIETSPSVPWGKRDRTESFVDEATRSGLEIRSGDNAPRSGWILVVSDLIDDNWCLDHRPYRAAGSRLSGRPPEVLAAARARREEKHTKKDGRRSTALWIVLLVLMATGLLLGSLIR